MGIAATSSGDIVIAGVTTTAHTYRIVKMRSDGTLGGCGDPAFGTVVDAATVSTAVSTLVATDSTYVATTAAVTGTPVTVTPGATTTVPPANECAK